MNVPKVWVSALVGGQVVCSVTEFDVEVVAVSLQGHVSPVTGGGLGE